VKSFWEGGNADFLGGGERGFLCNGRGGGGVLSQREKQGEQESHWKRGTSYALEEGEGATALSTKYEKKPVTRGRGKWKKRLH